MNTYTKHGALLFTVLLLAAVLIIGCSNGLNIAELNSSGAEEGSVKVRVPLVNPLVAEAFGMSGSSTSTLTSSKALDSKAFMFATRIDFIFTGDSTVTRSVTITEVSEPGMYEASFDDIPEGDYELEVEVYNSKVSTSTPVVEGFSIDMNAGGGRHFTVTSSGTDYDIPIGCSPVGPTPLTEAEGTLTVDSGVVPFQFNLDDPDDIEIGSEHWFAVTPSTGTTLGHLKVEPSDNAMAIVIMYPPPEDPGSADYFESFQPMAMAFSPDFDLLMDEDSERYDLPSVNWGQEVNLATSVNELETYWFAVAVVGSDGTTSGSFDITWNGGGTGIENFDDYDSLEDDTNGDDTRDIDGIQTESDEFTDITTYFTGTPNVSELFVTSDWLDNALCLNYRTWEDSIYQTFNDTDTGSSMTVLSHNFTSSGTLLFSLTYEANGTADDTLKMWLDGNDDGTVPGTDPDFSLNADRPYYEAFVAVDVPSNGDRNLNWLAEKPVEGYSEFIAIDNIMFIPD